MSKPTKTAWAAGDPASYTIEPSTSKKSVGWLSAEKPPYQYMNWIQYQEYLWTLYFESKTEAISPTMLISTGTATWNGSTGDLVLAQPLDVSFRVTTDEQINRIAAGTLNIGDGEVLVMIKDKENSSPVTLASGTYATLDDGQYDIVLENTLTDTQQEKEVVLFRRRGTNLECVLNGLIYATGSTITFGQSAIPTSIPASSITGVVAVANGGTNIASYAVGDLLYASGATTLSKLADVAAGSFLRSGGVTTAPAWSTTTFPNSATTGDVMYASASNVYSNLAGVATGNVLLSGGVATAPAWGKVGLTTHVSGTLPVANGGTGVTSSTGSTNNVLSNSPTIDSPTFTTAWTGPGSSGQNAAGELVLPSVDPPSANAGNRNSFIKAWLNFVSGSGSVSNSYNIAGLTSDDGDNIYAVTWDTDFSSTAYCVAGSTYATGILDPTAYLSFSSQATTGVTVASHGTATTPNFSIIATGVQ